MFFLINIIVKEFKFFVAYVHFLNYFKKAPQPGTQTQDEQQFFNVGFFKGSDLVGEFWAVKIKIVVVVIYIR